MSQHQHEKIIRNCSNKWSRQYQPGTTTVRTWQKLGPEHVIHLLENTAHGARADANALLRQLARSPWRIGAVQPSRAALGRSSAREPMAHERASSPMHAGGKGDERGVDPNPHVTVSVAGRSYHLGCKEQPGLHVISVTA